MISTHFSKRRYSDIQYVILFCRNVAIPLSYEKKMFLLRDTNYTFFYYFYHILWFCSCNPQVPLEQKSTFVKVSLLQDGRIYWQQLVFKNVVGLLVKPLLKKSWFLTWLNIFMFQRKLWRNSLNVWLQLYIYYSGRR